MTEEQLKRRELLFEENTPREAMCRLSEGQLELFSTDSSGQERRLMCIAAVDFLMEGALLEETSRQRDRVVDLALEKGILSQEELDELLKSENIIQLGR